MTAYLYHVFSGERIRSLEECDESLVYHFTVRRIAEQLQMPTENLLTPDLLRRVAWSPPQPADAASIGEALAELGARPWQLEATSHRIAEAFVKAAQSLEDAAHEPS